MTGLKDATLVSGIMAVAVVAVVTAAAYPADGAPKSPNGSKRVAIPLPELAPWHNRPAALGKGPNAEKAGGKSFKKESSKKTIAPTKKGAAGGEEPSVTALVAPDPNVWSEDDISENLKACVIKLASIQARVEIAEPFRKGACGAPAAVAVTKLGTTYPVKFSPPATLRCEMAVALYRFVEESLQPAAVQLLGSPIVSFNGISTYSCRNRYGDPGGKLSEHALANALDVGTFTLANGKTVRVLSDWGPTARDIARETDPVVQPVAKPAKTKGKVRLASLDGQQLSRRELRRLKRQSRRNAQPVVPPVPIKKSDALRKEAPSQSSAVKKSAGSKAGAPIPEKKPEKAKPTKKVAKAPPPKPTKEMRFLKRIHADACKYFGTVLGPEANEAHRDHFHFDMAPRRRSNYCR